jgi:hypothetical protein
VGVRNESVRGKALPVTICVGDVVSCVAGAQVVEALRLLDIRVALKSKNEEAYLHTGRR